MTNNDNWLSLPTSNLPGCLLLLVSNLAKQFTIQTCPTYQTDNFVFPVSLFFIKFVDHFINPKRKS